MRQTWLALRSFRKSLEAITQYRRATANLDERCVTPALLLAPPRSLSFPDATPADLQRYDPTCIVCREDLLEGKRLPCGHVLHRKCLKRWLERAVTCPFCTQSLLVEDRQAHQQHNAQQGDDVWGEENGGNNLGVADEAAGALNDAAEEAMEPVEPLHQPRTQTVGNKHNNSNSSSSSSRERSCRR